MKVADHKPGFWFLLTTQDERLLLDVNCEHSAVSYDVLIELNEEERAQYTSGGRAYLGTLAEEINYSAPGVRDSRSKYKSRNISSQHSAAVMKAIEEWRSLGQAMRLPQHSAAADRSKAALLPVG